VREEEERGVRIKELDDMICHVKPVSHVVKMAWQTVRTCEERMSWAVSRAIEVLPHSDPSPTSPLLMLWLLAISFLPSVYKILAHLT